jgi:hypothetical protein
MNHIEPDSTQEGFKRLDFGTMYNPYLRVRNGVILCCGHFQETKEVCASVDVFFLRTCAVAEPSTWSVTEKDVASGA